MQVSSQGRPGRVFVLRLEDGDRLPDALEAFARDNDVSCAFCAMLGGAGGGKLVCGPKDRDSLPPDPILMPVEDAREVAAVGTIFPDAEGNPVLHMHAATGRGQSTLTGCVRPGVDVWLVGEVVVLELLDVDMARLPDAASGMALLAKRG